MDYLSARRNEEKDQRRQSIIDAAKGLFTAQGVDATTIDQIARSCRISRSLIYTYFIDKNHLFLVVVATALEVILEEFKRAITGKQNGLDRISAIGSAYVNFALSNPEYYNATLRFQFSENFASKPQESTKRVLDERFDSDLQKVMERADQINQLIARLIVEGIEDGSIRKDIGDPLQVAISLWAITGGLILTSSANKRMFYENYSIGQDSLIGHGLRLALAGLRNKGM